MFNSTISKSSELSSDFILQLTFLIMQIVVLVLGACGIIVPRYNRLAFPEP